MIPGKFLSNSGSSLCTSSDRTFRRTHTDRHFNIMMITLTYACGYGHNNDGYISSQYAHH